MLGTKIGFYELKRQLGQGGMGAVYLAEHTRIGSRKVVKVLLPELSENQEIVHRFENEARASARLDHRNIIKIDDFGQLPNGQWYILMPFLEGGSLDAFLDSHGKLSIHRALHILVQICAALHAAHGAGIVHRDLKPANVFLTHTEENPHHVTLLDFGIAKLGDAGEGPATQTGAAFGTPAYMAVEQFEDASRADARSDIYALGVIAYQMVTGMMPFGTASGPVLYNKQITTRPPRATGVPYEWAELLLRALALRPVDRPQSARAFAVALAAVTPDDPPFEPSGTAILLSMARELVTHATPDAETVRNPVDDEDSRPVTAPLRPAPAAVPPGPAPLPSLESPGVALAPATTRPVRARGQWWLMGTAAALAAMTAVGLLVGRDAAPIRPPIRPVGDPDAAADAPPSSAAPMEKPPGAPPLPASGGAPPVAGAVMTRISIDSEPPGAALWVDGRSLGTAPQIIEAPLDRELQLRAELPGRAPALRKIKVDAGLDQILLRLERIKAPSRGPGRTAPRATPAKDIPFDPDAVGGGS